jgi:hypothetical protein
MANFDFEEFGKKAEAGKGCQLSQMLQEVPLIEQLAIVREFQKKQSGNASVDVKISDDSKDANFDFSIYQRKPPESGLFSTLESLLGRGLGDAQKTIEQAKGKDHKSLYGDPILHRINRDGDLTIKSTQCRDRF